MAFVSETRMVANLWLRPGNTSSANNIQGFLANTRQRLGNKRIALLRGDSGFSDNALLTRLWTCPLKPFGALTGGALIARTQSKSSSTALRLATST